MEKVVARVMLRFRQDFVKVAPVFASKRKYFTSGLMVKVKVLYEVLKSIAEELRSVQFLLSVETCAKKLLIAAPDDFLASNVTVAPGPESVNTSLLTPVKLVMRVVMLFSAVSLRT